ncbi:hypothetical protein A1O7_05814 [Cladophialophora yegresii CBS 114405]|uniref:Malonyl-CoA:ACP transacylase (MAT) domain-containing protein n=1 Tax=Cladophialophora yegresii CBS 114405 TaxID=1182544 RepID=W9WIS4_9EURO|nr:uncharacterized protein A1O7_05814 [Cladophialophora yegresii CBS 114405]EXJ58389.1 hypothetical protein A1O7_05814 [Cladophialophora yegresii CBS 114405]
MGAELIQHNEAFRTAFRRLDQTLQTLPDAPQWSLESEILKPLESSTLSRAMISQPANTALQIALVDMWAAFGVGPAAVIGHSSGEIAAAYAAKLLSAEEAITAAYYRGQMMEEVTVPGAMAGVGLSWKDTESFLQHGAVLACENSPTSTTISGDLEAVQSTIRAIHEANPNTMARQSKVDRAYHSPHMKTVGGRYYQLIKDRTLAKPLRDEVQFFSSVLGKKIDLPTDAQYWQMNLESPVRFYTALARMIEARTGQTDVFLEVGPQGALAYPVRQTLAEAGIKASYIASLARKQDALEAVLSAIGNLYANHVRIDCTPLFPGSPELLTDLPVDR